ncbi:hypothetical protein [Bradyrhizobium sp. 160]|uniref:hypothetical protein n=1 Tax=Bradyrhizobium sp. 160 TaxID=2782634 RepID=UPI001FF7BAE4|nr:hypothetical protein [Bradyrhizobium sp. 160]
MQEPSREALQKGVDIAAQTAKLTLPIEISALRKVDHGPGSYFVCLREVTPPLDRPRLIYSVFFDDVYKDLRQSVIVEACEQQQYSAVN